VKIEAIQRLRSKCNADEPVYGLWITLESPSITEIAVALGLDWVVIDAEHGHLDWKEIVEHLRATVRSNTVALVRVAELNGGLIKRALDIGADGVVVPWIETAQQLKQAISFSRYPLDGMRGIGAERATCWGQCFVEHTAQANEHVLVVPIIESVKAVNQVAMMSQVEGSEIFFFGPADFSSTAGYRGQWEGPGVADFRGEGYVEKCRQDLWTVGHRQCEPFVAPRARVSHDRGWHRYGNAHQVLACFLGIGRFSSFASSLDGARTSHKGNPPSATA
jgi:2-keto-3-deoxy-L-rhamnonate aldolase RhmA